MNALSWLGDIIEWFGMFIPRIIHVKATEEGVMYTRSKYSKIGPGIHIYLPLWSDYYTYPSKRNTLDLPAQILMTIDKKSIYIEVAVVYSISDIVKALVETYDLEDTIRDVAQGCVKKIVTSYSLEEIREDQEGVDELLTEEIRTELSSYGINVMKGFLTNISDVKVFRVIQNSYQEV
jgi:regulator of protease activity HflC (stomatin/prohibitin superfamily)